MNLSVWPKKFYVHMITFLIFLPLNLPWYFFYFFFFFLHKKQNFNSTKKIYCYIHVSFSYRMPHQWLWRFVKCVIFNFFSYCSYSSIFCHIYGILLLLSEINFINVNCNLPVFFLFFFVPNFSFSYCTFLINEESHFDGDWVIASFYLSFVSVNNSLTSEQKSTVIKYFLPDTIIISIAIGFQVFLGIGWLMNV